MTQVTTSDIPPNPNPALIVLPAINNMIKALFSANSGPTAPPSPVAGMVWFDTSTSPATIKRRNAANSDWIMEYEALGLQGHFARNAIINGNFAINQRLALPTGVYLAAGAYGHDRWKAGAAGCTYTFSTSENVTTITITSGSLVQVIEGGNLFSGTYVLSWTGTAQGKIGAGSYGASPITGAITGGSNLNIEFGIGTVSLVQFEAGSVATPFERTSLDAQLAQCQRYYERGEFFHVAYSLAGQNAGSSVRFKVNKRAIPTITQSNIATVGFSATPGIAAITTSEFLSFRTNITMSNGYQFHESFTADAEL